MAGDRRKATAKRLVVRRRSAGLLQRRLEPLARATFRPSVAAMIAQNAVFVVILGISLE